MGLPRIVPSSKLNIFKFYKDYAIHEAVTYDKTIFKLATIVPIDKSEDAYKLACELGQKYPVLISPSSALYRVWVSIECPTDFKLSFKWKAQMRTLMTKFAWLADQHSLQKRAA